MRAKAVTELPRMPGMLMGYSQDSASVAVSNLKLLLSELGLAYDSLELEDDDGLVGTNHPRDDHIG